MTFEDPRAYVRIANEIRRQITSGELRPGSPVTLARITRETGHAPQTAGKALQLLEREGMIKRYPGLGYRILETPPQPGPGTRAIAEHRDEGRDA